MSRGAMGGDPFVNAMDAAMQHNMMAAQQQAAVLGRNVYNNVPPGFLYDPQHDTFRPVPRVNRAEDRAHFLAADKFLPDAD